MVSTSISWLRLGAVATCLGVGLAAASWAQGPSETRARWNSNSAIDPFQEIHFDACPCWLTADELIAEVDRIHSDIAFDCDVSMALSAVEIKAFSSGVGGPFRSFVHTAQARAVGDSRCRHVQTQPAVEIPASAGLRNASERNACAKVVVSVARRLQCTGHELLK